MFADPTNQAARELCADALEQLGYQAESGTWRNAYLTGALELRLGNQTTQAKVANGGADVRQSMTGDMILDFIDIATDAVAAQDDDLTLNLILSDTGDTYFIKRRSGVLLVYPGMTDDSADCRLTCSKLQLMGMMMGNQEVFGNIRTEGDATVPVRLVKYMTAYDFNFNIIEP